MLVKSEKLAELIGVILGDGHIQVRNKYHQVKIAGNSKTDGEYSKFIGSLIKDIFDIEPKYYKVKMKNEAFVYFNSKPAVLKLIEVGMIPGKKVKNNVKIPEWTFNKKTYLRACIRGLIDTDGTVYAKYNYPKVPQIEYRSRTKNLIEGVFVGLKQLGYGVSKVYTKGESLALGIYGKGEVLKYAKNIGFSNQHYKLRFNNIINAPVV